MKAAAFFGKKDIRVVDIEKPKPEENGVVIKVKACGICGSDMHVYNSDLLTQDSTKLVDGYRIIGHEFTGEIVEVGKKVSEFMPGDRVASVHNKGGMAEYVEVHGDRLKNLFRLPDNVSFHVGATLEPLCNPMHSFYLRKPKAGETVAIFGAGIIGLGYLQIVKAKTNARTIVVDISRLRLDTARKIGADITINAAEVDPVKKIKEITGEYYVRYQDKTAGGCDIAIDCAGLPLTFAQTLEVLKPEDGTAIIAAIYEKYVSIDPNMIILKYMSILGSMGYTEDETIEALSLIGSGKIDRECLITHRFPIEQVKEAFETQGDPKRSIKVLIVFD